VVTVPRTFVPSIPRLARASTSAAPTAEAHVAPGTNVLRQPCDAVALHVGDGVDAVRVESSNLFDDVARDVVDHLGGAEAAGVVGVLAAAHGHDPSAPS